MSKERQQMGRVVDWLHSGREEKQYQAALAMRALAADPDNKKIIREAGAFRELVALLDGGPQKALTVVAAETISCLVADDDENRDSLREHGGVEKIVKLLSGGAQCECTHRALLALRILTDKEEDRQAIVLAGGLADLITLLDSGMESEITEYSVAALGNLAAGSQTIKDALREAGAIPPLVRILREDPEEISAELAAVVLRNMSLQNPLNRGEIEAQGGLQPLLQLLSGGLDKLHYPLPCQADFFYSKSGFPPYRKSSGVGQCCFDPIHGHLCIAVREPSKFGCFSPTQALNSRNKYSDRYSLLRKLTISEPDNGMLEINFAVADKQGVPQVTRSNKSTGKHGRRLFRIIIAPCAATEIKGAIMRMLTKIHMEREFGIAAPPDSKSSLGAARIDDRILKDPRNLGIRGI